MSLDLLLLLELETVIENGSKIDSYCLPKIVPGNAAGSSCSFFYPFSTSVFVKQFPATLGVYADLTWTFLTSYKLWVPETAFMEF